jgi:putative nucleotidyltransferase with HDIG domain
MIEAADKRLVLRRRLTAADGLPPLAAILLLAVGTVTVVSAITAFRTPIESSDWLLLATLAVPATLTQLFAIQKPRHQVFHAALVFVIAGVLLLPAPLLVLMCVLQHIPDWFRQRYRWYIQSFNICNYVLSSLAAVAAVDHVRASAFVVGGLAACTTFVLVNRVLLAPMLWLARGLSPRQTRLFTGEDIWVDFSLTAMGVSLAALGEVERWMVPLALAPIVLIYYLQRDGRRLERAYETIQRQNESLHTANELLRERSRAAMEGLAATVDARDAYTAGHSRRVRSISLAIGEELGLTAEEMEVLEQAALLHDIGKIAIPDAILLKPGRLEPEEWKVMRSHAEEGARIIARLGFVEPVVPVIRHHHERLDGSGYPDGLRGEEIPLLARIVHVADALDSMITTRVYRPRVDAVAAVAEIRSATGSQFCPAVVAAFERALDAGRIQVADGEALPRLAAAS